MRFFFITLLVIVVSITSTYAQTTPVNALFETELINLGIDTNGVTGNILDTDAQAVTDLNLSGANNITDITGINAFINVTNLNLGDNQIANIAPTSLTALVNFITNDNSALTTIDLTQNTLLETFFAHGDFPGTPPPITQIDLSQNINLISINGDFLDNVTDFIFPVTSTLTDIFLRYLADSTIDVSGMTNLETFRIGGWRSNVDVTLPNTTSLRNLRINSIEIPTIDLSVYTNLETLYLWGTYVQNLTLPNSNAFRDIFIILHDIQNPLDFSIAPNLTDIDITSNRNTPLVVDVTQNQILEDLDLSRNDMNSIDITQNPLLETVRLNVNNLTSLDVTQNPVIDRLEAYQNLLPSVDLTQNTVLQYLNLRNNLIPTLDVTQNTIIRSININNNLFTTTGLDLTQNIELSTLDISYNQIESLDITQNADLNYFNLSHNIFPGNDILYQFATTVANYGRLRGALIANNNLLFGPIPDFYGLYDPTLQTRRFELYINENRFHFGDFESQHLGLVDLTTTMSIGPSPDVVIRNYLYAPQDKVDVIENLNVNAGNDITLTTTVRGEENHYVWFKDGVQILDAPDAPEYTLTNVNSCDEGVYYSEIRSDLVPFENANAPGTNGKNLLLVRNDITLNVTSPTEACVNLTSPLDGSTNIPINESLAWGESLGACGYFITIGTTSGGTDILNNLDVGNVTNYNVGSNFPANTEIFVTITPYFAIGNALTCIEESFTTSATESPTVCTALVPPYSGTTLPISTNLEWFPSNFATGYFITIGTSPNGNDVYDMFDTGNNTTFNPPVDFTPGTIYYVTVIPYNGLGSSANCINEFFITESDLSIPNCTSLISPLDEATDVLPFDTLEWNVVSDADGYLLTTTTNSGDNEVNNLDISTTSYQFSSDFNFGDLVTVTIVPYNASGQAISCTSETFSMLSVPNCSVLSIPVNSSTDIAIDSDLTWDSVVNADGYTLSVGTSSGGTDIFTGDVGNLTSYNLTNNLPQNTQIFVSIVPYNAAGDAISCSEESFTTELLPPECVTISSPLNGAINVDIDTDIIWPNVALTDGYILNIGTTSGGTELFTGESTDYDWSLPFPQNTEIYASIIPYNTSGLATGCQEISFTTELLVPDCTTQLLSPMSATNVPINTNLQWDTTANTDGYILTVGSTIGGNDIVNAEDVGNTNNYNFASDLPQGEMIYVIITPYNLTGNAMNCTEYVFETETIAPGCSNMITPAFDATNVPVDSSITWSASTFTSGYTIALGTATGLDDILTTTDVGNVTSFIPPSNLPSTTTIFVTITSYNDFDLSTVCGDDRFTTEEIIPECTGLSIPVEGSINVAIDTDLQWNAISNATGYVVVVGTQPDGTDIVSGIDVGNVTSYTFTSELPQNTEIFVTIQPYNSAGINFVCVGPSFTTELLLPECTQITSPINGENEVPIDVQFTWDSVQHADGYTLSIGTSPGNTDVLNNFDVGNVTSIFLPEDLPSETILYATVISYNTIGKAINCSEITFTTEVVIPNCADEIIPFDNELNVSVDSNIVWNFVDKADGYIISIGTSTAINDIADNVDVGNINNYNPNQELPDDTIIYVSIIAYNEAGNAVGCNTIQFTTENREIIIPKFFTPNGDSNHDYWVVEDPKNEIRTIYIFNRLGKLLKNTLPNSGGWDGRFSGNILPNSDYWYRIELRDGGNISGHFTLKR